MEGKNLVIGKKYKCSAFKNRVKLVKIIEDAPGEGCALVTVEYRGRLYTYDSATFEE